MGERFDDDPFVLFQLRGRTKEQIIAALRARRSAGVEAAPAEAGAGRLRPAAAHAEAAQPLAESLDRYWEAGPALEALRFTIAAPEVEAAPVKQLGEPRFWKGRPPFLARLETAYAAASRAALSHALGEAPAAGKPVRRPGRTSSPSGPGKTGSRRGSRSAGSGGRKTG